MENTYFKMIGQKAGDGKLILIAVVDEGFMDCNNLPSIFEVQNIKLAPTIYTGTYPTIKVNTETIKERTDLIGNGIDGIITSEQWYCVNRSEKDALGIGLETKP